MPIHKQIGWISKRLTMWFIRLFKRFVDFKYNTLNDNITCDGCHIAVGKFRMLDSNFIPSHIIVYFDDLGDRL